MSRIKGYMLKETLNKIYMTDKNGLVWCNQIHDDCPIGERYHIQEKALKLGATAVFFRRKYEKNEIIDSKPVVYIYEREDSFFNSEEHKKLHAEIWSAGDIDVYFIVSKTRIDICNARKPAEVKVSKETFELTVETLGLVSSALEQFNDQRFSAIVFGKGIFWEQADFFHPQNNKLSKDNFFENRLTESNAPFYRLLECLMSVRKYLHKYLDSRMVDKLLIVCILVKFLEVKDGGGTHTINSIYKKENINVKDFADALDQGKCLLVLEELARDIQGNIFNNLSFEEKQEIEHANLKPIADFLRATLDPQKQQYFLWEQYSFKYLPVELISSIYENFLHIERRENAERKEKGIVYTPPFLVNFLVDEVMPLNKAAEYCNQNGLPRFKVLDPACGSGVFLVAAYKRMLEWWKVYHYQQTGHIEPLDKEVCQQILEENIWGIDIHETATFITIFSLTIALLDNLEPKVIWNSLQLHNLKGNIQHRNFFEWSIGNQDKTFDLVIGNPPFNPQSDIKKKDVVSDAQMQLFGMRNKDIPGESFALKFFEGAMFLGEKTCMILPSNALLYNKAQTSQKYRNRIFTKYTIEKIFDFTHLRRELFSAETAVCAVLAYRKESQGQPIEHTVIKRIISTEKKITLEIDHYDRHLVRHDWALDPTKQFIWKTNLLGGGRLFHLIYRLSLLGNLKQFIQNRKKENGEWIFQDGYKNIVGNSEEVISYIYNHDKVSSIRNGEIIFCEKEIHKNFKRPRPENLYKLPLLLIHKKIGNRNLPIGIKEIHSDDYLVFNSSFVGIHAPEQDFRILENIYKKLKQHSETYLLWILTTSPSAMIGQDTAIKKTELDTLPFPENEEYLEFSNTERILQNDVLNYYIHLGKAISEGRGGRKLYEEATTEQLHSFGKTFCDIINPMHAENGMFWQIGDVYQTPEKNFIIYEFIFGLGKQAVPFEIKQTSFQDLNRVLNNIIMNDKENRSAVFTRVTRIYGSRDDYDYLILIKPTATRYWLNSIAIRDADETAWDYYEAGF